MNTNTKNINANATSSVVEYRVKLALRLDNYKKLAEIYPEHLAYNDSTKALYTTVPPYDWGDMPLTLESFRFFTDVDNPYEQLFPEEVLRKVLPQFKNRELANFFETALTQNGENMAKTGYCILCHEKPRTYTFKEYRGEWSRDVNKPGYRIILSSQTSSHIEGKIFKAIMEEMFAFLKNFHINYYSLRTSAPAELYLDTPHGVVYVPVRAITENNPQLIYDRHTSYHKWYYQGEDRKQYLDKALSCLETDEFKAFLKALNDFYTVKEENN